MHACIPSHDVVCQHIATHAAPDWLALPLILTIIALMVLPMVIWGPRDA